MGEIVGLFETANKDPKAVESVRPKLKDVTVSEVHITHRAIRDILDERNATRKTKLVELMRLAFVADSSSPDITPPSDYMVDIYENIPAWIGAEGSPHGKGNYDRVMNLLSNPKDKTGDRFYLDRDFTELGKNYEWEQNAVMLAKFEPYHVGPRFVVAAVRLIALESDEIDADSGRDWLDFGK